MSPLGRRAEPPALDEGRLLADHAIVLQVRNRIEIAAIREGRDFAIEDFRDDARAALRNLAWEQELVAGRLEEERRSSRMRFGPADSQHDYRRGDRKNLRIRERTARMLATELRAHAEDVAYLDALIERARQDAWRDVSGEIRRHLRTLEAPPEEPDAARSERISGLAAELARLAEESAPEY